MVAAADELHNARAILDDLRRDGARVCARFNAGKDEQLWYYRSLAAIYTRRNSSYAGALKRTVEELEDLGDEITTS